jgi:phosphosulfolactate phosphohydrolase-like enzyme
MGMQFDESSIQAFIKESCAAQHLCGIGYTQDVEFIARVNMFDVVPVYDGTVIRQAGLCTDCVQSRRREISL